MPPCIGGEMSDELFYAVMQSQCFWNFIIMSPGFWNISSRKKRKKFRSNKEQASNLMRLCMQYKIKVVT